MPANLASRATSTLPKLIDYTVVFVGDFCFVSTWLGATWMSGIIPAFDAAWFKRDF
jgi:hypothetical protein